MARLVRKIVRWSEVYGRILAIALLFSGVLFFGVWHALSTEKAPVQDDFGDASTSDVAKRISNLSYEEGQALLDEGDQDGGRAVMQRLAPISNASNMAKGHPLAHLWMAKLFLGDAQLGVLDKFPIELAGGVVYSPSYSDEMKEEVVAQGIRHLEAAVTLDPKLDDARKMLAEWFLLTGKRNDAYKVLYEGIRQSEAVSTELMVPLLHSLVYRGDDMVLEEWNWHEFATLGRGVTGSMRGDQSARLCYVFLANVLKEYRLADVGAKKYAADFEVASNEMSALAAYVQAVYALTDQNYEPKKVLSLLLEACKLDPSSGHYARALSVIYQKHPQLKAEVQAGVKGLDGGTHSVDLAILMTDLSPNAETIHGLMEFMPEAGKNPNLFVALVRHAMGLPEGISSPELMGFADALVRDRSLSSGQRHHVLAARGTILLSIEKWQEAAESFEMALAIGIGEKESTIHASLAQCYKELGSYLLQDEHEALVRK